MRVVPVLALAACAGPLDTAIVHESTLQQATKGLVLHEDGLRGHAGMFSTNCPFETTQGSVTGDYDLPGSDEDVQDGGTSSLGAETVVLTMSDVVHLLEKSTGDYVHERHPWTGVRDVRLTGDGLVGLVEDADGCAIEWRVDGVAIATRDVACDDGFDAALDGTVVVGGAPVVVASPDGEAPADAAGRLVAWDDALGLAYVADPGGDEVSAVGTDGALVWTTPVPGAVVALSAAGARGAAVVSLERSDGSGAVVWIDGATGDVLAQVETPSAAPSVTTSGDGSRIALVLPDQAHFYSVDLEALSRH